MVNLLPNYISEYNTATASAGELLTLGRLYSMVGDYASSVRRGDYAETAGICRKRFRLILNELYRRGIIDSEDELYAPPSPTIGSTNIKSMTVDELEQSFRMSRIRYKRRLTEGREPFTRFYETGIVNELATRNIANAKERLKADYCRIANHIELENMSFVLRLPYDGEGCRTASDIPADMLAHMIELYGGFQSLTEREMLAAYVDYGLNLMEEADNDQSLSGVAAMILELDFKEKIRSPYRVKTYLAESINHWIASPEVAESAMVIPMLTLAMVDNAPSLERRAKTIINHCYRRCTGGTATIDDLHIATRCCDYVSRFSSRRMASCWNDLCTAPDNGLSSSQITRLLEAANEIEDFAPINQSSKNRLTNILREKARSADILAQAVLQKRVLRHPETVLLAM